MDSRSENLSTPFLLLGGFSIRQDPATLPALQASGSPCTSEAPCSPRHTGLTGFLCSSLHPHHFPASLGGGPCPQPWPPVSEFQWPLRSVLSTGMRPKSTPLLWILSCGCPTMGCLKHVWGDEFWIRNSFLSSADTGEVSPLPQSWAPHSR